MQGCVTRMRISQFEQYHSRRMNGPITTVMLD